MIWRWSGSIASLMKWAPTSIIRCILCSIHWVLVVHAWEEQHHPMPKSGGAELLQCLMEEHHLTQSDLPDVGSQGVVSEILAGKRELNVRQIRALSERFGVSPSVFV